MIFQIIFSLCIILAVLSTYRTSKTHHMTTRALFTWILVWVGALLLVWVPNATSSIALLLGIGRGVDVVLYTAIAILFFLLFRLHVKFARLDAQLTTLVREQALEEYRLRDN
jgi:hypothetical protein